MNMKTKSAVKKIAVIGGGASGLAAAVFASREAKNAGIKAEITIYEANGKIGKKILVTGNGRCNFSNTNVRITDFHGDSAFAYEIYRRFDNNDCCEFFRSMGVVSKADSAGRIYPMSLQASSVLDAFRYELEKSNVKIVCDFPVEQIARSRGGYLLNNSVYADCCILATGGKAAPVHGSNGSGFNLVKPYNIRITSVLPALTALVCDKYNKGLKGVRAQGTVKIKTGGKVIACDTGEIQYTDYGLSGIPSMQVSGFVSKAIDSGSDNVFAYVDSCPSMTEKELNAYINDLIDHNPHIPGENLLSGIIPKKLGVSFLCDCSVNPVKPIGILNKAVIDKIITQIKNKKYVIKSVKGFNDAQVSCGGISTEEICSDTLELKKLKNIFVCGEIVDVDGDCGGYNLQWAWSSGYIAGINAVREINSASD